MVLWKESIGNAGMFQTEWKLTRKSKLIVIAPMVSLCAVLHIYLCLPRKKAIETGNRQRQMLVIDALIPIIVGRNMFNC
ncbi:hypothetical protein, partial [Enterobacter hormaechei]|uniref:hypothetical protein n=1 Tax=Enterobacter hormaechei TaxID=158836 RepID=UPI00203A90A3